MVVTIAPYPDHRRCRCNGPEAEQRPGTHTADAQRYVRTRQHTGLRPAAYAVDAIPIRQASNARPAIQAAAPRGHRLFPQPPAA